MKDWKSILLVVVSTALSLCLCEAGLRLFTPYGKKRAAPARPPGPFGVDLTAAAGYAARMPLAPGTELAWFRMDPPPLTNRRPVPQAATDRYHDFERRGLYGPQAQYIFNRVYLEANACKAGGPFQGYPDNVLTFTPPHGSGHPVYRFPPSATLPSGLVTNRFGFRGPEMEAVKPPKTVRLAFVGASTTVAVHSAPFSYPEYVVGWLNRFAAANHFDVRFEVMNAGREGINSEDISAIVSDEVAGLDPDYVVYYEGANQFSAANLIGRAPRGQGWLHIASRLLIEHTALGDLYAHSGVAPLGEPRKPWHHIGWPAGVDEQAPDVDSAELPLQLPVIVHDLDRIRGALQPGGGKLVMASFVWLARAGLPLTGAGHWYIYQQLNGTYWPLTYAEIRRLADFQNRVFRRYASSRGVDFVDVAGWMPQDPDLFVDAIHTTDAGDRLRAWTVFQQLAPMLRRELESGRLPRRAPPGSLPRLPALDAQETAIHCR